MTNQNTKKYNIRDRALEFAARVAKFVRILPRNQASFEYGKQVIRSSASIGANIEEADGTLTKKDFINKMAIGRREARESRYWLQLIGSAELTNDKQMLSELVFLTKEAEEIMLILSSIINKCKSKR